MVAIVAFFVVCAAWLTVLTFLRKKQKHKIDTLELNEQENVLKIRQLTNEVEYLRMIINGKEETSKKS